MNFGKNLGRLNLSSQVFPSPFMASSDKGSMPDLSNLQGLCPSMSSQVHMKYLSGGQGVVSSNLAAPTKRPRKIRISYSTPNSCPQRCKKA